MKNPIQPIVTDEVGILRFKENKIVNYLLDWATERGMSLNELAAMSFSNDDRQQFAQLIGYSVSGYGDLSDYVDEDAYGAACEMAENGLSEKDARIAHLDAELTAIRRGLREPIARLFGRHPDDIMEDPGSE